MRRFALHLARFLAFLLLYLALTENLDWSDIAGGVLSALLATIALGIFTANTRVHFPFTAYPARAILSLPYRIARDSVLVLGSLALRPPRDKRNGRFYQLDLGQPHCSTWRALRIIDTSIAPDTYAVSVDKDSGRMLVHELVRSPQAAGDRFGKS